MYSVCVHYVWMDRVSVCMCGCVYATLYYINRSPRQGTKRRQKLLEQIAAGLSDNHFKEMFHLTAC